MAANLAIDRETINQALTLGQSKVADSVIPADFEFFWQPPAAAHDPAMAKQLLKEAGYSNGFDAGDYYTDSSYAAVGEAVLDNLRAVGIRAKLRPIERAAFHKGYTEKTFKNIVQVQVASFGNAATRLEAVAVKGGAMAYGSYPDIDALFQQQAGEMDRTKREAILHRMQQLVHERTIYAPNLQPAFISGVGHRVGQSGFGPMAQFPHTAPYEDLTLISR